MTTPQPLAANAPSIDFLAFQLAREPQRNAPPKIERTVFHDKDFKISVDRATESFWKRIGPEIQTLILSDSYETRIRYHGVLVHRSVTGNDQRMNNGVLIESHPNALWIDQLRRAYDRMHGQQYSDQRET